MCRCFAACRACIMNAVEITVEVGTPRVSSQAESWIHHDAQPPQSPQALTTASTLPSLSAISAFGVKFLRTVCVFTSG